MTDSIHIVCLRSVCVYLCVQWSVFQGIQSGHRKISLYTNAARLVLYLLNLILGKALCSVICPFYHIFSNKAESWYCKLPRKSAFYESTINPILTIHGYF